MGEKPFFLDVYTAPAEWPRWLRRVWLLTLPVSGPLYIFGFVIIIALILVIGLPCMGVYFFLEWAKPLWSDQP